MDLRSGHPFWLVRNGLLETFPALNEDLSCEVLVVGGGITGALVGYHLIEAGISTVVVDKRDIGWGSTAASTALLQYEIDIPLHELQEMVGADHATRCYQACRDAIYKIRDLSAHLDDDCGFELKPSLYVTRRRREIPKMRKEYAARRAAGFDVAWWDAKEMGRHLPFTQPCGIYSKDGGQVDAYRLTYRLLAAAQKKGLRVHDRTTVLKYETHRSGVRVKTDRGVVIKARRLIFANGYEAQEIVDRKLVKLHSSFALASEPLTGAGPAWHEECLIWEHATPYLYVRTTKDRRVIIGGEDEEFRDSAKRDALIGGKTKTLLRKFRSLFPDLPLEVAFAWAGTFGETKDGLPFVDQLPGFPRAWFTLGFGGNGITYSVIAAEIVRDAILGKANPYQDLFRFER